MSNTGKKAPRLRWHHKDDLVNVAVYRHAMDTAESILRALYLAEAPRRGSEGSPTPEQMRESAAAGGRRLLDLDALLPVNGADRFLVAAAESTPRDADFLEEARALLNEVGTAPAKREED